MGIFGNSKLKLFAGEDKVKKAYLGTEKIYSAYDTVTYYVDRSESYQEEVAGGVDCLNPTTFTPSKSGWTFVGWREDTVASGDVLSSKVMGDEPITLYAVFKQTIYLYYNGNDASGGTVDPQSRPRYYNASGDTSDAEFTLASNGYNRSGYTFTGWNLGAVDATVTLESNTTAYAQWSDNAYYAIQNGDLVNCANAQAYIDGDYWDNSCGKITGYGEPYFYGFSFRAYEDEEEEQYGATGYAVTGNMSTKGCKYMTVSVASRTWVSDYPNGFAVYANGDTIYSPTMTNSAINTYTIDVSAYSTVSATTWRHIGGDMVAVGGFVSIQFHN